MNKHLLTGCRPTPLASYLKAIGLLRLVSEQKDPEASGCWQEESFVINTALSREDLQDFFCKEYAPTPIVAPWNGGSGFYLGDSTYGIDAIATSNHERFAGYREVISQIRGWREIPSFNTVKDVLNTLQTTLEVMQPGKKRDELEGLVRNIHKSAPPESDFASVNAGLITLVEVENRSKQRANPNRETWNGWWKSIRKARTECNAVKRNENKNLILTLCRARLPELTLQWLDAVYVLKADNKASYNPILGTGGNEGHLEMSNNFMQRLAELLIDGDIEKAKLLFLSSVFNTVLPGLVKGKIGQYDPGRAGGYNQGMEVETKDFRINPWDFILALEGSLVLASAVARRHPTDDRANLTIPFTVWFSSVGFSSSAYEEKGRQETWLPIWRKPASYREIRYLFAEGRSTIGRRMASTGIEFSRAVGTLGVDRGIDAFERYAFLERRGKSYVALPAGRIKVRYRPDLELLNELDRVTSPALRFMREFKTLPATFQGARRRIDETIFVCSQKSDSNSFCDLVRAIGDLERLIATRDRSKKPVLERPIFGFSPQWVLKCDDGSVEVRVAAALASIRATGKVGPLRSNMSGVDPSNPRRWSPGKGDRHWFGSGLAGRLAGVLSRRLMDAARRLAPCVPIEAGLPLCPKDVMPFLWGECDDGKIEELLWGFTLIDWNKFGMKRLRGQWEWPLADRPLSRAWSVLKLLYSPAGISNIMIKMEPRIAHLLTAGRITEACAVAVHRLHVSNLCPYNVTYEEELDPTRVLASLLIPIKNQWELEYLVLEDQTATSK